MQYVSITQLNVLVPVDSSDGNVAITVSNSVGTSPSVIALLQAVLPGPSTLSGSVRGVGFPDGAVFVGAVAPCLVFSGAYPRTNTVTVTIRGISANVLWAGMVGPGLYQINIQVPANRCRMGTARC